VDPEVLPYVVVTPQVLLSAGNVPSASGRGYLMWTCFPDETEAMKKFLRVSAS